VKRTDLLNGLGSKADCAAIGWGSRFAIDWQGKTKITRRGSIKVPDVAIDYTGPNTQGT
jgi:hypothetical protein